MDSFTINGWRQYQRYTDRLPKWIAIYSTIRDDLDIKAVEAGEPGMTDEEMGHVLGIFCLATRLDRPDEMPNGPEIPLDPKWVQKKAGLDSPPNLKKLISIGLFSCNKMLQSVPDHREILYHTGQDRTRQDKTGHNVDLLKENASEVLEYLNSVIGKNLKYVKEIEGCLKREKCSVEDCKVVIDYLWREWGENKQMRDKVDHTTPFRAKNFARYLDKATAQSAERRIVEEEEEYPSIFTDEDIRNYGRKR